MPKNLSLPPLKIGHNVNSAATPKKKEKQGQKIGEYIRQSMKRINDGCYENGKLKIDGNIGDYHMSVFRLKDRKKRLKDIPSAFTRTFVNDLKQISPHLEQELDQLVDAPNQQYLKEQESKKQQQKQQQFKKPFYKYEEDDHLLHPYVSDHQRQKWFSHVVQSTITSEPTRLASAPKKSTRKVVNKTKKQKKLYIFQYMQQKRGNSSGML